MSTLDKFRNYRQRRSEMLAHRAMTRRELDNPAEAARAEMLLFSNRMW
ncbi:hypothetical protein [Stackebrandtia soli]